jgi:acetyl-CoA carboxylase biotin carboxylase subunit
MFKKVLIANRGEIAIRVMRTLKEMGIATVAVYSEADRRALHVRYADEAYCVGPAASRESYLRMDKILEVAKLTGAEAIHPGYGFLSENAEFAQACADAGVVFIGPPPSAIEAMGEKTAARRRMIAAGVPVVPGTEHPIPTAAEALVFAEAIGFPVLIKAAAGGGGKGMRRVDEASRFEEAFDGAQREARSAFGNEACYVEKFVVEPKHVEIQVLCDEHGNGVSLFERDCSVQRRHQKVVEESPCAVLPDEIRRKMGEVAVQGAKAVGYVGAGTFEFLLDRDKNFYFLEMNTRLQVEHPVTEAVVGVDLVEEQIHIAAGRPLRFTQQQLSQRGHAIEVRIYAEDPANQFLPSPGLIRRMVVPQGPGVRNDSGYDSGTEVSLHYDPMVAKFIVTGETREKARLRLLRALDEYQVDGIANNIEFLKACLVEPDFVSGSYDTGVVNPILERFKAVKPLEGEDEALALAAAALSLHLRRAQSAAPAASGGETDRDGWRDFGRARQVSRLST